MLEGFFVTFLTVLVAETGGPSQLFAAAQAHRHDRNAMMITAIGGAAAANCLMSAYGGFMVGQWISEDAVVMFGALALILAGGSMLLWQRPVQLLSGWRTPAAVTVFAGLFILQLGDSGQFLIAASAARTQVPLLTAAGGYCAIMATLVAAVLLRGQLARLLPLGWLRAAGGSVLLLVGMVQGLGALRLLG